MADAFRAYDIRGLYPTEVNEQLLYNTARAFAQHLSLSGKTAVVGMDNRLSSPALAAVVRDGLTSQGVNVVDLGLCTTPMFYWAIINLNAQGGLMVTASHNPKEYNGLKICGENARFISMGSGLEEIERLVRQGRFASAPKSGIVKKRNLAQDYARYLLSFKHDCGPLKVAVDTGNGVVGVIAPLVFSRLPLKGLIPLFFELNGNFPNHSPNPMSEESAHALQRAIIENGCDIGLLFDADGDRVILLDEKGQRVPADIAGALLAEEYLQYEQGAAVVYCVRSSWAVREHVIRCGGRPVLSKAGRTFIQASVLRENAIFGIEKSGHYFARENHCFDSALLASLRVLSLVSRRHLPLSELVKPLCHYASSEELNFTVSSTDEVLRRVEEKLSPCRQLIKLDGLTMEFSDWWFNLRASNTEPVIRLNVEARTVDLLKEKLSTILEVIAQANLENPPVPSASHSQRANF